MCLCAAALFGENSKVKPASQSYNKFERLIENLNLEGILEDLNVTLLSPSDEVRPSRPGCWVPQQPVMARTTAGKAVFAPFVGRHISFELWGHELST